ncbi:ADP-ribosylglycohydrolase family protein [Oscillospiraceae bacterium PP1C4]
MGAMKQSYIEKIYAGWLGKIIGIRLGASVEGWTYENIRDIYGELINYPVDFQDFAADDDSNGPIFFIRALEDSRNGVNLTAQDVGEALLNYTSFEKGFFWWGGYGVSTEHTAYLNLRNGIKAPQSGSVEHNGAVIAEQIGGQIFIDTWGLVCPANPDLAAKYAEKAASVTHGGNGVYGGIFVAVCISLAFEEENMKKLIRRALTYIPKDCEYARMVNAVTDYYENHPDNWRDCFHFVKDNFGYDRYGGNCHIIPNAAVIILSLLYGSDDFSKTITICNMCGWDTDCNTGNVGAIMGVKKGLSGIDDLRWRKQVNDFLACSSVVGSLNIMDIPFGAAYIAKQAYAIAGEQPPEDWKEILYKHIDSCHFEFPGSTHAIRIRNKPNEKQNKQLEYTIVNSDEAAHVGLRSLKLSASSVIAGDKVYAYKKTYYTPADFHDNRYQPCFSPVLYPGQTVNISVMVPSYVGECLAKAYVRESRTGQEIYSDQVLCNKGSWQELKLQIPSMSGALIDEAGVCFTVMGEQQTPTNLVAFLDDLFFSGTPEYQIDFSKETIERWKSDHEEISQFTRLKGNVYLEEGSLNLSCADYAEAYTGGYDWKDYQVEYTLKPLIGTQHYVNFRVQGALRSYAVGLLDHNTIALLKNENGYKILVKKDFAWQVGKAYTLSIEARGNKMTVWNSGERLLEYTDCDFPYLNGCIGVSVRETGRCSYQSIKVKGC